MQYLNEESFNDQLLTPECLRRISEEIEHLKMLDIAPFVKKKEEAPFVKKEEERSLEPPEEFLIESPLNNDDDIDFEVGGFF